MGDVEKRHVRDRRRRCCNRDAVAKLEARRLLRMCYVFESHMSILLCAINTNCEENTKPKMRPLAMCREKA